VEIRTITAMLGALARAPYRQAGSVQVRGPNLLHGASF
jgi:hypothetical protein